MSVPYPSDLLSAPWAELSPEDKRSRLLAAAAQVLSRDGIDAPMPAIAAAAGIGIGSVYRQFVGKEDLIAALVIDRLTLITAEARAALEHASGWDGLTELFHEIVARQTADDLVNAAIARTSAREDVSAAVAECSAALDTVLTRARDEGAVRADAVLDDCFLIFAATRAAEQRLPGGAQRMLVLLLDALRA